MENNILNQDIQHDTIFASSICRSHRPEFLEGVKSIFDKHIAEAKKEHQIYDLYPVCMSGDLSRVLPVEFVTYVAQTAWDILNSQGYNMRVFETYVMDMWGQQHHRSSGMDQHMHINGAQISGIYVLKASEDCKMVFHDPRPAKVYSNLPEAAPSNFTLASPQAYYSLSSGNFIFHNSCLNHSFPKNPNYEPLEFVHFNLSVRWAENTSTCIHPEVPTII